MAVTTRLAFKSATREVWDVQATADADTDALIPHTLGASPVVAGLVWT